MLKIYSVIVTPFQQNARILIDTEESIAVVVDPGGEIDRILAHIPDSVHYVSSVILTHAHIDHGAGVKRMLEKCEQRFSRVPQLLAYHDDQGLRATLNGQALAFGLPADDCDDVPEPDQLLEEGDEVSVGSFKAKSLFTPGHSPDHLAFFFEACEAEISWFSPDDQLISEEKVRSPLLVAGDALFAGSIGRTDLPGGDHQQLLNSISSKLLTLPGETRVMPGHGPDTSIAEEKRTNPFVGTGV